MHELGIVMHVAKTVNELAKEQDLPEICSVTLQIGEVSGIVPEYFIDCWNYFKKKNPPLAESELLIETIPAVTFCEECRETYETVRYGKTCPYCGGGNTYLVQGNETVIKEIVVPDDDVS